MPFWRCTSTDEWLKLNLDSTYFLLGKYHRWAYLSREAIYVFWRHDNLKVLHSIDLCLRPISLGKFILDKTFKLLSAWELVPFPSS